MVLMVRKRPKTGIGTTGRKRRKPMGVIYIEPNLIGKEVKVLTMYEWKLIKKELRLLTIIKKRIDENENI